MRDRLATAVASLAIAGAGALPIVAWPSVACAGTGPTAALVIDGEDEGPVYSYCVALPDDSVSGTELIQLAAEQYGVTYRLDSGGGAVCMLQNVGPSEGECFGEYPEFWGYWRGDGSGGWTWSGSGASSTTVEDGDVEGWSWGEGDFPSSHPAPPMTTHESLCGAREPSPQPVAQDDSAGSDPAPDRNRARAPAAAAAASDAVVELQAPAPSRTNRVVAQPRRVRQRPPAPDARGDRGGEPAPTVPATVRAVAAAPPPPSTPPGGGPPAAGLAGIAASAGVCAIAARGARRRAKAN